MANVAMNMVQNVMGILVRRPPMWGISWSPPMA